MTNITVEDVPKGVRRYKKYCKKHGYNPDYIILPPNIYSTLFGSDDMDIPVQLLDGTEITMKVYEYKKWFELYGRYPESYKYNEDFENKLLGLRV
jgi:hypothetical protein